MPPINPNPNQNLSDAEKEAGRLVYDKAYAEVEKYANWLEKRERARILQGFLQSLSVHERNNKNVQDNAMNYATVQAAAMKDYYLQGAVKGMETYALELEKLLKQDLSD